MWTAVSGGFLPFSMFTLDLSKYFIERQHALDLLFRIRNDIARKDVEYHTRFRSP